MLVKGAKIHFVWLLRFLLLIVFLGSVIPYLYAEPQPSVDDTEKGLLYLQDALIQYQELEWPSAIQNFKLALRLGLSADDQAKAYWHLALLSYSSDKLGEVEPYMLKAFRAKPNFRPAEPVRGNVLEPIYRRVLAKIDFDPPQIRVIKTPNTAKRYRAFQVTVEITDQSPIVEVLLTYPELGVEEPLSLPMRKQKNKLWQGEIPKSGTLRVGELPFRVSAEDDWHNRSEVESNVLIQPAKNNSKLYLYGGTVLTVGAGIIAYLLRGSSDDTLVDDESWPKSLPPQPPQ